MSIRHKMAAPFAHLLGNPRMADDEDEKKGKNARRAEDDDRDGDEKAEGSRAEDGDQDGDKDNDARRAEDDDKKDEKREGRKAKSKADDDDDDDPEAEEDDDEDEMRGKSAAAKARRRERARCAAIFGCKAAGLRPDVAATLAFSTTMGRREAIKVLSAVSAGGPQPILSESTGAGATSLDRRMASLKVPSAGTEAGADIPAGMSSVAAAIIAAGKKVESR